MRNWHRNGDACAVACDGVESVTVVVRNVTASGDEARVQAVPPIDAERVDVPVLVLDDDAVKDFVQVVLPRSVRGKG